jgi:hypothetical protein
MKDAYQVTKFVTTGGLSKELEAFVPKTGAQISSYAESLDKVIGAQPLGEVMDDVFLRVKNTSVGQSSKRLVDKLKPIVESKLDTGTFPGYEGGNLYATNLSKMNEARTALNREISSNWFKNGMPTATSVDQLNALKWEASTAIKDMMIQSDKSGYFSRAINLQHAAMSVSPVLAERATSGFRAYSKGSALFASLKKAGQVPQAMIGRAAAGAPDALTRFISGGGAPSVPTVGKPLLNNFLNNGKFFK